MLDPSFLMGMRIQQSPYATTRSKKVEVVRNPIRKRRRNWGVRVTWVDTPAAFVLEGRDIICHPSIFEKLMKEFKP